MKFRRRGNAEGDNGVLLSVCVLCVREHEDRQCVCVCSAGGPERAQGLIWVPEFFKSRWLIKLIRELKRARRHACQSQMDGIVGLSLRVWAGTSLSLFFPIFLSLFTTDLFFNIHKPLGRASPNTSHVSCSVVCVCKH